MGHRPVGVNIENGIATSNTFTVPFQFSECAIPRRALNDEPLTARAAPSRVRYVVLVFLCAAATVAYVQRNSLGVVETEIRKEFDLTEKQSAWVVSSAFFLTYALFQVPTGWLGHVWGSRRALPAFSLICSAAAGLFSLATGFPALIACRGAMGLSQAGLFPCATGSIKSWMPVSPAGS
jgi:sugar phosphate permease